jgi:hypothetical protein
MSVVWAVVFVIVGLLCMLNGYKFYKGVTIALAMTIGLFAGYHLGKKIDAEYIVAGCLAVLLAVGCWPLMKYAVAAMGGLAGAFVGANAWSAVGHLLAQNSSNAQGALDAAQHYWIGALLGLIVCGMLAFVLFKLAVVVFTSVSGSTIAVIGAIALLLQFSAVRESVAQGLSAHALVVPLLVLVPAAIALILQQTQPEKAGAK